METQPHQNADAGPEHEKPRAERISPPDSVPSSVPSAERYAGKQGPDANDPPRAADKPAPGHDEDRNLDPDEAADAFETGAEADEKARTDAPDRRDEDQITLDTPD